jgi:hypothetical protein
MSQKHEDWQVLTSEYDDGGLPRRRMEAACPEILLEDIAADMVDTVVVYKFDRLR